MEHDLYGYIYFYTFLHIFIHLKKLKFSEENFPENFLINGSFHVRFTLMFFYDWNISFMSLHKKIFDTYFFIFILIS